MEFRQSILMRHNGLTPPPRSVIVEVGDQHRPAAEQHRPVNSPSGTMPRCKRVDRRDIPYRFPADIINRAVWLSRLRLVHHCLLRALWFTAWAAVTAA